MGKIRLEKNRRSLNTLWSICKYQQPLKWKSNRAVNGASYNPPCVLRRHPPPPDSSLQRQPAAEPHLRRGVSFHLSHQLMWKRSFNLCRNQWPIRRLCPCLNVLVLRFVGGWRLLTLEKWIIDLAMVINLFKINHKSVCAWETESAKRWHVISQGQWGGALRRNLYRPHFTWCFSPRPYKCQMARLVNEMNMSQGVLHLNRWEQRTLHILSS